MPKAKKDFKIEKAFTIFLPLFILLGTIVLAISSLVFQSQNSKELEAIITDGKFNSGEQEAYFMGKKIAFPDEPWPVSPELERVLAAQTNDDKWIEIDLSHQRLRAWEGNRLIYEFLISTGKRQWGAATPVGVYRIWIKLRSTKMSGGSGSTYYYLPNVQCTQYFYRGYGVHGTYWHSNFGHPMSHGCVNMRNEDACTLFYWTSPPIGLSQTVARPSKTYPGTKVVVHGWTPWE